MIGRTRTHRTFVDDLDPDQLNVFIPGALASGFLVSIGLLLADALRKVAGDTGASRKVTMTSAALAAEVRTGGGASSANTVGVRPRWVYGLVGGVALGLAVGAIPGASWNFLNPVGYIGDIGWIWALSLLVVVALAAIGIQAMRLAPHWWPIFFLATGTTTVLRFAFGNEAPSVRRVVVIGAAALAAGAAAATWRLRRQPRSKDVPPSTRPLLVATPLGKAD